jgi:phosphoketolase
MLDNTRNDRSYIMRVSDRRPRTRDRGADVHEPLSTAKPGGIAATWRAANSLSVGQIYLYDNPLLKAPLVKEHVKHGPLGHFGTTPGLTFIYAHLNRTIRSYDLARETARIPKGVAA